MSNEKLEGSEENRDLWLPQCMWFEIMSRLPSKTLAWARFVSKEWEGTISDPKFVKRMLKRREQLSGFFLQDYARDFREVDAEFKPTISYIGVDKESTKVEKSVLKFLPEEVVLLSSSNGLVCSRSCFPCLKPLIYVFNPLTKKCVSLEYPDLPDVSIPEHINNSRTVLIFEPQMDVSSDFLVVTVCQTNLIGGFPDGDTLEFGFKIYSSRTRTWTDSSEICTYNHNLQRNKGCAIVEGTIFWLTYGQGILRFDPENEVSFLVMKPFFAPCFSYTRATCIGEAEGSLYFVRITEDELQLWELVDWFSSEWSAKPFISLEEIVKENPGIESLTTYTFPLINPLSFKDMVLFLRVFTDIYAFNFDTRKAKLLCPYAEYVVEPFNEHGVFPYTMSLVPLS